MIFRRNAAFMLALLPGLAAQPVHAQQRVDHLESCAPSERNADFVRIRNGCDQPVSLIFWRFSLSAPITRTLQRGEVFQEHFTGDSGWWMSTACPLGYDPDPPFLLENTKVIVESTYRCVSKQISMLH
ncbi:MAG: hypothetical protein KF748_01510 [Xanthobacteraceae bacterium]|nr:hypothetical protein [Xanthobacteraceae bacterium]